MSNGWTVPTSFLDEFRELQKQVARITRGATAASAAIADRDDRSALAGTVAPVIYRDPGEPVAGGLAPNGSQYPMPLPSNAVWFDTDDGNRVRVRSQLNDAWVEADQILTGITLQTNPESDVGLKFADNGLVAYDLDGEVSVFVDSTTGTALFVGGVFSGGEVSGAVVTGGLLRTSVGGKRIEIDGPGDIIKFFSGVINEASPGIIDPINDGVVTGLMIRSGTTTGAVSTPEILLYAGTAAAGGRMSITAPRLTITSGKSLIFDGVAVTQFIAEIDATIRNGSIGTGTFATSVIGAGGYAHAETTASANVVGLTYTDLTSLTTTISSTGTGDVFRVDLDIDSVIDAVSVSGGTGSTVTDLLVDGGVQPRQLIMTHVLNGRTPSHKTYTITGLTSGDHDLEVRTRCGNASTNARVREGSTVTVTRVR